MYVRKNRALGLVAKRRIYEGGIVSTTLYGAETWNMREADRDRVDVFEMGCLQGILGVPRMDRVRTEDVRQRTKVESCLKGMRGC